MANNDNNITLGQLESALITVKNEINKKADRVHGTHVAYSATATSLTPGESGNAGSAPNVARGDHTHTLPAYPTALKSPNALTIKLNGSDGVEYDGSAKKEINVTPENIGAAPTKHASSATSYGVSTDSLYGHAKASSTLPVVASTASAGTEISSFARGDHVHPMQTYVTGNAGTATKLEKPIMITIGNVGKEFDGSKDMEWTLADAGGAVTNHASSTSTYGLASATLYGHAMASSTQPKAAGMASAGNETAKFARGDHVHPIQTTITGNAGTATKLETGRNIIIGNLTQLFDGTKDLEYSLSDIGAIPLAGLTSYSIGGSLLFGDSGNNSENFRGIQGKCGANDYWRFGGSQTDSNSGYAEIATGDDSNEPIYVRQYSGAFSSITRTATLLDASGNTDFPGSVSAQGFVGNIIGNATSADKLNKDVNLKIGESSKSFNGSTDVSWSLAEIKAAKSSVSDGAADKVVITTDTSSTIYLTGVLDASTDVIKKSTPFIQGGVLTASQYQADGTGARYIAKDGTNEIWFGINEGKNKWGIYDNKAAKYLLEATSSSVQLNGNASTATKLQTSKTINRISFDGSSNVIIPIEYYTCSVSNDNTNQYHRIMTTGITTETYTDKSITIYLTQNYHGGKFGIARVTLRTNSATSVANGEIKWLVRSGFDVDDLQYNIINTAGEACLDVFYKSNQTYASITWHVLAEGGRASYASSTFTKYNTSASTPTEAYTLDDMKALRLYTSTCVAAVDDGVVGKAITADKALKLTTARSIGLSGAISGSADFDGSAGVTISTSVVNPPRSGDWFSGGLATVDTDGVIGIGKYIDFHNTDTSTRNFDTRLQCNSNAGITLTLPSSGGTLARTADNVASATKLKTAHTINGTNFDGTENITTANWGTARNIKIADSTSTNTGSTVSVNGSGDVTLKLPATIKATLAGNADTATKLASTVTINGTNFDGSFNITTASWGTSRNIYIQDSDGTNKGSAVAVNGSATATLKLPSTIKAKLTGNADTATKLATSRNITVGNKTNSFNGTAAISFSLADIGAVAKNGDTMSGNLTIDKTGARFITSNETRSIWFGINSDSTKWGIYDDTWSKYLISGDGSTLTLGATTNINGDVKPTGNLYLPNGKNVYGQLADASTNRAILGLNSSDMVYVGNTSNELRIRGSKNPKVQVGSNTYTLFHSGNHTLADHVGSSQALNNSQHLGPLYFKSYSSSNAPVQGYVGRVTTQSNSSNVDYASFGLYDPDGGTEGNGESITYLNCYEEYILMNKPLRVSGNIRINNKYVTISDTAPSSPNTGDIWIQI